MKHNDTVAKFESAIHQSFLDFKIRLDQQRLFLIQENLLRTIYKEVSVNGHENTKELVDQYKLFNVKLIELGKTNDDLINEKIIIDTYSSFERFLADCYSIIYGFFPKYIGSEANVGVIDLFFEEIDVCQRNVIEAKVKSIVQSNNISDNIKDLNKKFKIKMEINSDDVNHMHEISLIRNLIIHNNSRVNRIHINQMKRLPNPRYVMKEDELVCSKLEEIASSVKEISFGICDIVKNAILDDSIRLYRHHLDL